MSAAFLNLTEEETRRCKLYHLVVDGGGAVLRYRFDRDIPTPRTYLNDTTVKLELYQLQTKNIISKAQYELLYPSTGAGVTSSKDYDMTLLVALHRTLLCAKKGDPIWHTGNKPAPTDFSVEAEIVRLRDFRNELMHSPKVGGLTEAQFETKWKEVSDVLSRFGSGMPGLQEKLEILKNDCLDKRFEKELLLKLEEWTAMDKAFGDEMMKTLQSNSLSDIALERSRRELSDVLGDPYFVKTSVFQRATDILNEKGIIVIKGAQGEGKTTMGKKLVKNPDRCLKINNCSDWDIRNHSRIDTVLIDDMFGSSMFDKGDSRKWLKYIPQIKDDVQNKRLTVIITSRSYILDEVLEKMYVSHLINESNTLTISSKDLTEKEMRDILEKHMQMKERELNEKEINECINEASKPSSFVIGFPECARLFCQHEQFFLEKSAFFRSPMAHIKDCLVGIFKNKEQVFLAFFVLWAQKSQEIMLRSLQQPIVNTPQSIIGAIEQLQYRPEDMLRTIRISLSTHGTDFIHFDTRNEIFSFCHRVISDAVGLVAYEKNETAVLKCCDSSFIERYIRIEDNGNSAEHSDGSTNEIGITIPPLRFDQLCSRMGEIIQDMNGIHPQQGTGNATYELCFKCSNEHGQPPGQYLKYAPFLHPAFRNTQFCELFIKDVMKGNALELLTMPVLTFGADLVGFEKVLNKSIYKNAVCLLAYLLKNRMTQFASVCYREMKNMRCRTGEMCSSVTEVLETDLLISMILAIKRGDQYMIENLAKLGAPVGDLNVMLMAFKMADRDIVTFLLDLADRNISSYRKNGKSPLILFVEENNIEAVKCLLNSKHFTENEIDFQSEDDPCNETALHKACKNNQDKIVEQLLLANPNLLLRDVNGYCPIHVAALAGNVEIVEQLLKHNMKQADYPVNLSDNLKHVKLYHIAVWKEDADVIELLERLGISPGCTDDDQKKSPLMFAIQEKRCQIVMKLTDISVKHEVHNMSDHRGNTALHIAIEKLPHLKDPKESELYKEVISFLCQTGINVFTANLEGKSALMLAEESKQFDVMSKLERYKFSSSSLSQETETEQNASECDDASPTPAKRVKHA